ncbi:MAG: translation elongation factor 4, partial [Actinomycetota bacterium]
MSDLSHIRNFCIVAHIDHGKSTLADRLLDLTHAVESRAMREQYLDKMDIERERGITIKAQSVRLRYEAADGHTYVLNLIDTPGHVDFSYEVSRALAACEGAVLLVDAAQGIEAQTLANLYLAIESNLTVIPVMNKIDLPAAQPERVAREIASVLGVAESEILQVSAKTGEGVAEVLERVVAQVPPPKGDAETTTRALIYDSLYDPYRGVISYVRVFDGRLAKGMRVKMMATGGVHEVEEVGTFTPEATPSATLSAGEVGYVIPGLKAVSQAKVGDTVTSADNPAPRPLPGYREPKPVVFAGLYPMDGDDYPGLRDALEKLRLNDASFTFEPETSHALGFGFRCGFLGLLHLEIARERLEREFGLDLLATTPNVAYRVRTTTGGEVWVRNPSEMPNPAQIEAIEEP